MSDLLPGITDGLQNAIWKVCIVYVCVRAHAHVTTYARHQYCYGHEEICQLSFSLQSLALLGRRWERMQESEKDSERRFYVCPFLTAGASEYFSPHFSSFSSFTKKSVFIHLVFVCDDCVCVRAYMSTCSLERTFA